MSCDAFHQASTHKAISKDISEVLHWNSYRCTLKAHPFGCWLSPFQLECSLQDATRRAQKPDLSKVDFKSGRSRYMGLVVFFVVFSRPGHFPGPYGVLCVVDVL